MAEGYEPRCKICKHGYGERVNNMLILGYSYSEIVRIVNEDAGCDLISSENIVKHKRHLGYKVKTLLLLREQKSLEKEFHEFMPKIYDFLLQFVYTGASEIFSSEQPISAMTKDFLDKWLKAIDLLFKTRDLQEKEIANRYFALARAFEAFSKVALNVLTPKQKEIVEREYKKAKDYIEGKTDEMPKFSFFEEIEGGENE